MHFAMWAHPTTWTCPTTRSRPRQVHLLRQAPERPCGKPRLAWRFLDLLWPARRVRPTCSSILLEAFPPLTTASISASSACRLPVCGLTGNTPRLLPGRIPCSSRHFLLHRLHRWPLLHLLTQAICGAGRRSFASNIVSIFPTSRL